MASFTASEPGGGRAAGLRASGSPPYARGTVEAAVPLVRAECARPRPWVRGPAWDAVWMLSGLWLAPLVLLLSAGPGDARDGPLDSLYFALTALFWLGHRVGSAWVAYGTEAYAPLRRAHRGRVTFVPLALAAVCFALVLPPDHAIPFTRAQRVMGCVIVDYVLVTYHFASQHFGVLSLYRLRAGRVGATGLRRLDRLFALGVGGALVVVAEVTAGTVYFMDVWIHPWLSPAAVAAAAATIRAAGIAVAGAATVGMLVVEMRSAQPSLPRAAYVLSVAAMVVVAFHVKSPFVFLVLWSAQHWIVATGLTTLVVRGNVARGDGARGNGARGDDARDGDPPWRFAEAVNRRPWAVLLLLTVASVALLPFLEVEGADADGALYAHRVFGAFATALRTSSWAPVLVALGLTTAFLHYWLDRTVYRFSHAPTREAARGLLATET